MKKLLTTLCAAALALTLCGCAARTEPAAVSSTFAPAAEGTPAPEPAPGSRGVAALPDGAADDSALSGLISAGPDGTLYTGLVRAEGLTCLYDLLPEDAGYIAGFLAADDGIYAAVRENYYSLEPAALYFYPYSGDGGGVKLADAVAPGGLFCLAGDSVFYESAGDGSLMCLNGDRSVRVLPDRTRLLCARGGLIYYARDGGVYQNDSTMGAETRLFDEGGLVRLLADETGLYALSNTDAGAVLTVRDPDGTLRAERALPGFADSAALCGGRLYVPQGQSIAVLDTSGGEPLGELALPEVGAYCLVWYAAPDAVYYEDYPDGSARLCRIGTDGEDVRVLGERLFV